MTDFSEFTDLAIRLGAATMVGGMIGLNRDMHGKPAGLRMLGLVALGAALATVSVAAFPGSPTYSPESLSRIIQGVLTGVGFLGAAVIMRDESGNVHRLNTAASVWVTAVLGVICGLCEWMTVALGVILVLILLTVGARIDRRYYGSIEPPVIKPGNEAD
jgi:putative Mg2+ transporter-C (MgtC) family protein